MGCLFAFTYRPNKLHSLLVSGGFLKHVHYFTFNLFLIFPNSCTAVPTGYLTNGVPNGDPVTGVYPSINGVATINADYSDVTSDVPYEFVLLGAGASATSSGVVVGGISNPFGTGGGQTVGVSFTNIPSGDYTLHARVDLPAPGVVVETPGGDESGNNQSAPTAFTLPEIPPNISIDAVPKIITPGGTSTIVWSVDVIYEIDCSVSGFGVDVDLSTQVGPLSGSELTPALNAETDYTITCSVPHSGNTYSQTATVKVLPLFDET